eukprot:2444651-Pleurochrysis_carterae.AAC.1
MAITGNLASFFAFKPTEANPKWTYNFNQARLSTRRHSRPTRLVARDPSSTPQLLHHWRLLVDALQSFC